MGTHNINLYWVHHILVMQFILKQTSAGLYSVKCKLKINF